MLLARSSRDCTTLFSIIAHVSLLLYEIFRIRFRCSAYNQNNDVLNYFAESTSAFRSTSYYLFDAWFFISLYGSSRVAEKTNFEINTFIYKRKLIENGRKT